MKYKISRGFVLSNAQYGGQPYETTRVEVTVEGDATESFGSVNDDCLYLADNLLTDTKLHIQQRHDYKGRK